VYTTLNEVTNKIDVVPLTSLVHRRPELRQQAPWRRHDTTYPGRHHPPLPDGYSPGQPPPTDGYPPGHGGQEIDARPHPAKAFNSGHAQQYTPPGGYDQHPCVPQWDSNRHMGGFTPADGRRQQSHAPQWDHPPQWELTGRNPAHRAGTSSSIMHPRRTRLKATMQVQEVP
jgi:hypothetical protein